MKNDVIHVNPELLFRWNKAIPRYTSYPTAPQFHPIESEVFQEKISSFDKSVKPLSLYVHIPFCKTMCLFCGCSVVLNRKPERQSLYLEYLFKEIEQVARSFSSRRDVSQLHFGGGTPTSLTEDQFEKLMAHFDKHFHLLANAEISIEIDPRTVYADKGGKLALLKKLGFNRVSFGVQDLDPIVQEAVRRRQSEEMTVSTYYKARELGFDGINIDLIYGLPHQTVERFVKTADRLVELRLDRIAFYSYAKVPWIKEHQKAIPDATLPSTYEKFQIYSEARARFMEGGYTAIGMDHFSLASDTLATAYLNKTLTRNFQGYSIALAEDMIGFGVSSIGFLENSYFQNAKDLTLYQEQLKIGNLPVMRGYVLNEDDIRRREAILSIMCHFQIDKLKYGHLADVSPLVAEGLLEEEVDRYVATPLGRLFIRLVASSFDAYLGKGQFSKVV